MFADNRGAFGGSVITGNAPAQGGETNVFIRLGNYGLGFMADARMVTTSGTVLGVAGAPVSGVRVSVALGAGGNLEVTNGPDGKYSITWQSQTFNSGRMTPFVYARDVEHNLAASQDIDEKTTNLEPAP